MTRPTPIERTFASTWVDEHGVPATRDDLAQAFADLRHERAAKVSGRETWLTVYVLLWRGFMGGEPAMGPMAKALRPLHEKHGPDQVHAAMRRYLLDTEAQYVSLARFASTYGVWAERLRARI
jgi:hypothetical protein